jgi:hypothetical protein
MKRQAAPAVTAVSTGFWFSPRGLRVSVTGGLPVSVTGPSTKFATGPSTRRQTWGRSRARAAAGVNPKH